MNDKGRWLAQLRGWAKGMKRETRALYLAARDPRTPLYAKLLAAVVVAYAFSPIDLIPDFVPVLGYLDDLLLVPLGVFLVLKLIPQKVMDDCRQRATAEAPASFAAAATIVVVWLLASAAVGVGVWKIATR